MGRYISFGIVYRYIFEKQQIEREYQRRCWRRKEFKEMKEGIIRQLFPDIYDYEEDDKYLSFTLSNSVKSEDLIECIKTYYSLVGPRKEKAKELEDLCQQLERKTIHEAYEYSKGKPSCRARGRDDSQGQGDVQQPPWGAWRGSRPPSGHSLHDARRADSGSRHPAIG